MSQGPGVVLQGAGRLAAPGPHIPHPMRLTHRSRCRSVLCGSASRAARDVQGPGVVLQGAGRLAAPGQHIRPPLVRLIDRLRCQSVLCGSASLSRSAMCRARV